MLLDRQRVILDPITAYDLLAPRYAAFASRRRAYRDSVDRLVIRNIQGASSLLDVGAGDGRRTARIAAAANISKTVLVEPSAEMRKTFAGNGARWIHELSEVHHSPLRFDAIICLWNVLGHVARHARRSFLSQLRALLNPGGSVFLDVNHRYNAPAYGWTITLLRWSTDLFFWSETRGDVIVDWQLGERRVSTLGHVFTHTELARLFGCAGLKIERRWIVDYRTGEERNSPFLGNLLYQLRA